MSEREKHEKRKTRMEAFKEGLAWVFHGLETLDEKTIHEVKERVLRMWVVHIRAQQESSISIDEMQEVYGEMLMDKACEAFMQWKNRSPDPK